jgi:hypothetical protein
MEKWLKVKVLSSGLSTEKVIGILVAISLNSLLNLEIICSFINPSISVH